MIVERQEIQHVEALAATVNSVPANLPYNVSCVHEVETSNYNIIASAENKATLKVCSENLGPGAYANMLCSASQIGLRYMGLSKEVKVQEETVRSGLDSDR